MQEIEKMTKREFSESLMRRSPENSDEYWAFHRAYHYYEAAECEKNKGLQAGRDSMKAVRAYKKGWKLRENRLDKEKCKHLILYVR